MNIICIILARKGSIRLKNKNLKTIGKHSLVERSIMFAKKIFPRDKIILSTDSNRIKSIGIKLGLKIHGLRPKNLSTSYSSSFESTFYEIQKFEKYNKKIDAILLLQPTTPFRSVKTYKKIKKKFLLNPSIPLMSVKKLSIKTENLFIKEKKFLYQSLNLKNSRSIFIPTGAYFFISKKKLFKNKSFYAKKMNFFEISNFKENIDIDHKIDLKISRKIFFKSLSL